jgi:hypothetical protein
LPEFGHQLTDIMALFLDRKLRVTRGGTAAPRNCSIDNGARQRFVGLNAAASVAFTEGSVTP